MAAGCGIQAAFLSAFQPTMAAPDAFNCCDSVLRQCQGQGQGREQLMLTTAIVGLISAATAVIWAYKDSHASMHRCDPEQDVLSNCQRISVSHLIYRHAWSLYSTTYTCTSRYADGSESEIFPVPDPNVNI